MNNRGPESYKHKIAKTILAEWLRGAEKENVLCEVAQFSWQTSYGVFEELKFHENDDIYYFENSPGRKTDENGHLIFNDSWDSADDWFETNGGRGKIVFIPDITVFHKGTPIYFFEIFYKGKVIQRKIETINNFFQYKGHRPPGVYEISAGFILNQKHKPEKIECERLL